MPSPNQDRVKFTAAILRRLPSEQRDSAIEHIRAHEPNLASSIEDNLFEFDSLADLDTRSLQRLLRKVNANSLVVALKGLDINVLKKFFTGMSQRAAENLSEDLECRGRVRFSDVEAERKNIIKLAHSMAEVGEIALLREDDRWVE